MNGTHGSRGRPDKAGAAICCAVMSWVACKGGRLCRTLATRGNYTVPHTSIDEYSVHVTAQQTGKLRRDGTLHHLLVVSCEFCVHE